MDDHDGEKDQRRMRPTVVELDAGVYFWCRCGETSHPPFCDGSHREVNERGGVEAANPVEPLRWKLDQDRKVALCNCKRTGTPPLCDGSHARG